MGKNKISVRVRLHEDDRALLDSIRALLEKYLPDDESTEPECEVELEKPQFTEVFTADDDLPFDLPEPESVQPSITLADIRKKVTQLRASGDQKKKDGAKGIVKSYAENITGLPEDKYPEIWEKLTALEQEG